MLKLEDIKSSSHVMSMKAHPKLFSIRSNNFYESKDNFRSYPKYSLCVYLETWRIRTTLIKNKTAAVKAEKTHWMMSAQYELEIQTKRELLSRSTV